MKKRILALFSFTLATGCSQITHVDPLPQGITFIENHKVKPGEIGIPYNKYQLDNGLTVILHHDDSDPLVHVDVTYHVGSAREELGKSGFAHLFEHMMFQGSEHVADEQHFKIVTEAGGTLNGTTNSDRTNYYETVPSNQLEKMLWLESDRMGFFLPALTKQKFEVQRETVKNERAQRIDNRPYGRMGERFAQALYPQGHPYSWPVIGWTQDLNRADVDDVKSFFSRWYGPNNATLTIGGDFDETEALQWVAHYFGEIPRGPEVVDTEKTLVTLDDNRYLSMEDKVHLPLLRIGFPTVYARHEDEAALDLLANIIGGGKTSILYKNLVKDGYSVQASASHPCSELACQFAIFAIANPAKTSQLAEIQTKIEQSIRDFEARGVTDADLEKVKVQFKANTIFGLQSVASKVSTLAYNQTFTDVPDRSQYDLDRYSSVTKEDVMRVFERYIKSKPFVAMSVVPEGKTELIAHKDTFMPAELKIPEKSTHVSIAKQITSAFDRDQIPQSGQATALKTPDLMRSKLKNGIEILAAQSFETPTVELVIYLNGGHRVEPVEKSGLASLTAAMMNESSKKRTSEELSQALELLGSSIQFTASSYQTIIQVSALTENLDQTLKILNEKLFEPDFDPEDFARLKQQQLQGLQHQKSEPTFIANTAFSQLLYGKNTALGNSSTGSIETVSNLSLDDVKAYYQHFYRAGNAKIVVVSNLTAAEITEQLMGLNRWQGQSTGYPKSPEFPALKGGTIYLVDKPDAAQSVIKIGMRALPYDATGQFFHSYLMNYPLGGAFNSRINLNLREDKGYTYGARSGFRGGKESGDFTAQASVRSDVTAESVGEFINEIQRYQAQGITQDELAFMKNSILQGQALDYESPYQKAGFMRRIQWYGLDDDFTEQQADIIKNVSKEEIDQLAKQLDINNMVILIVGDKAKLEPKLRALGYPIEDY